MHRISSRTPPYWSVLFMVIFGILLCLFPAVTLATSAEPSPGAESDLICHTSDPKECYPRKFQATNEFQVVHDDQEIGMGLHVRLNIWTGQKEAKLYDPSEDDDPALEGLPVDSDVVVVEGHQAEEPLIPDGAPAYDNVGKIKGPEQDAQSFVDAMDMLRTGVAPSDGSFDERLEGLEDIAHDIYYGLKVTEDEAVLKSLLCLLADQGATVPDGVTPRDQQAAAILGAALQNNPAALKEVEKKWLPLMSSTCPGGEKTLKQVFYTPLITSDDSSADPRTAVSRAKAKVGALNGLIKSDPIRSEFLQNQGMEHLLAVLVPEGKEWAATQRKAGLLALDNFLDEDMGAKLGQWPQRPRLSDTECWANAETKPQEGCWDYHVERIMKANKRDSDHWSKTLHDKLSALDRKAGDGSAPPRNEL